MRSAIPMVILAALVATGCSVVGTGPGSSSPFFDDADTRKTGILDGYVFVSREPDAQGRRPLTISPFPLDPTVYIEANATNLVLSNGAQVRADSRGFYVFDRVNPGEYTLTARDSSGAFDEASGPVRVLRGAITSGLEAPVGSPEVRSSEYWPMGRDDYIRFGSIRGLREWRWTDSLKVNGVGVRRVSFVAPGGAINEEFFDVSFSDQGILIHGNEMGIFDPPVTLLPAIMRFGDRFDMATAVVERVQGADPGNGEEPRRTNATFSSALVDVNDLVLAPGRFDNCPKLQVRLTGEGIQLSLEVWLAFRMGPVRIVRNGMDHQIQTAYVGGVEYR